MAVSADTSDLKQLFVGENRYTSPSSLVKKEDVKLENELHDCIVCSTASEDNYDIYSTKTSCTKSFLYDFLCNFTRASLTNKDSFSRHMCKFCYGLVNILEEAEAEYLKLRSNFENVISKNPLFGSTEVKKECDSDDEPLAVTRGRRKDKKPKKKVDIKRKPKRQKKENVEEDEGKVWPPDMPTNRPPSPIDNGFTFNSLKKECIDDEYLPDPSLLLQDDVDDDDDHDDELVIDDDRVIDEKPPIKKKNGPKKNKEMHKCDQCDAKYASTVRLMVHKMKHEGSKPPYICEICGAHYKHRKACDIHIALHKGISDWKCEECDKLFPSKAALQRHNNIHTGKANYQCDLCGKSFIHTSSFKMHKLAHSGVKPHTCGQCGLALMTRSHLKRHARVHSGEKKHQCPLCGKRFSERYNLVAHGKAHDAAGRVSAPAQHAALQAVIAAVPLRRLFRCSHCDSRYERRHMLERHMQTAHHCSLEKPPPKPRNTMSKLLKAQAATTDLQRDGFSSPPAFLCLVAEVVASRRVVGFALYFWTYSTWGGRSAQLEDLCVRAEERGRGVGGKLFDAVASAAVSGGCVRVDFHVLSWNPAREFYRLRGATDLSREEDWLLYRLTGAALASRARHHQQTKQ